MKVSTALGAIFLAAASLSVGAMPGAAAPGAAAGPSLKGEVLEAQNVSGYTYLRLKTKDGEQWAAVSGGTAAKGQQVTLEDTMVMENFESKAMKRRFDRIVFGTLSGGNAGAAKPVAAAAPNPHGGNAAAPAAPVAKVAKATGADARTVAEVHGGSATLKGKTVTVRGQVVKVTSGILGKNWVHLQDGSGNAAKRNHDLIFTTQDDTKVGEVIVASGTVRTDVNIGSGYAYAVLVEDAKLKK